MVKLPVIVGFGGYNASGRSSNHYGFLRTVFESLEIEKQRETVQSLAAIMDLDDSCYEQTKNKVLQGTLIRQIEKDYFDVFNIPSFINVDLKDEFTIYADQMPKNIPLNWNIIRRNSNYFTIKVDSLNANLQNSRDSLVKSAGQLPKKFNISKYYNSRFHPRALQMAILGASDCINSSGIDIDNVINYIGRDKVAVFSGNIMSQLDSFGFGGMLQARLSGQRVTAKQCPLGFNSMPTDFINSYILGSLGGSSSITGACASFLYNLQKAIDQIKLGRIKIAIVGTSEAPITIDIIEGYNAMSALATEKDLQKIQKTDKVDFRLSSRPFGENSGFTIAESSQYLILMSDDLVMETGSTIYGSIPDVFINADGFKRSISSPGIGNYISLAKSVAYIESLVGKKVLQENSFVQAHGSSTPGNRVSESMLLDKIAKNFDLNDWPITAVKSFVGHSLSSAAGDQIISSLGTFAYNIIPGIKTIDKIADDVSNQYLDILLNDTYRTMDVSFVNSKGFGGNNASSAILSDNLTKKLLIKRYGNNSFFEYSLKNEKILEKSLSYNEEALKGELNVIYKFGLEKELKDEDISFDEDSIIVNNHKIFFTENDFEDLRYE